MRVNVSLKHNRMNNLKCSAHRAEKEMLKSLEGELFLTNFLNSKNLQISSYRYDLDDEVRAHVIEEYPIPKNKGITCTGCTNIKTRFIDFVYIISPGNAAIFRGECFSVAVEIKTSISDLYKDPLQILRYFGKTDYLFLCVPKAMKEEALEYVKWDDRIGVSILENGEILRFPEKQELTAEWKDTLLLRALFAQPMLPMMNFKPR